MTRQTEQPLTALRTATSLWPIDGYIRDVRRDSILLDSPYQRGPVWTTDQRIDLMRSWLQGVPIPAVVLNDRTGPTWDPNSTASYAVVDGRQRLETARAWLDGHLAIPASWLPPDWIATVADTDDGPYVRATMLAKPGRVQRLMDLTCVRAHLPTVEAEAALYLLLNGAGTPQSTLDLARATAVARG